MKLHDANASLTMRINWLFCIFLTITGNSTNANSSENPVKAASIDLSEWDGESVIRLDGPWDFYWQKFLEPDEPWQEPDLRMKLIEPWHQQEAKNSRSFTKTGFGTYRLELKGLKARPGGYALLLSGISCSAQVIVSKKNSDLEMIRDQVGKPKSYSSTPSKHPLFLHFHLKEEGDISVIVHVANHDLATGGIWKVPIIGPPPLARKSIITDGLANAASMGIALAVCFYSGLIYWRRRQDLPSLYLALFSLSVLLRSFSTTDLVAEILPENSFHFLKRLEYFSMPMIIMSLFYFLHAAFFPSSYRLLRLVIMIPAVGMMMLILFTPTFFYSSWLLVLQLHIGVSCCVFSWLLGQALVSRKDGAALVLAGVSLAIIGTMYDLFIVGIFQIESFFIGPITTAVFLLIQSQLVAKRSANAYRQAELYAAELVEKEKARTTFFHNTSHELRTPLNGIIGFIELLRQGRYGHPTTEMSIQFTKVLRLATSLKNQVNMILDLAKSKRGELEFQNSRIDLNDFIQDIESLASGLQLKHPNASFELTMSWDSSLEIPHFIFDREKLLTIVRNLLGNAFKFNQPQTLNTVSCHIRLDDQLLIEVRDQGIGIPDHEKESIFSEFKQVQDDARRAYEGTGLGLALVKRIVELSGGSLKLESQLGQGSCFQIALSNQDAALISEATNPSQMNPDFTVSHSSDDKMGLVGKFDHKSDLANDQTALGRKILVVDDNEMNCEVIRDVLGSCGYKVDVAGGGRACLEYLKHHRPDLVLLDLMMPEVSGEDVLVAMKNDSLLKEIPVILVTARATEEDRIQGLKMGADDYLAKPIIIPELILRVKNLLSRIELTKLTEHLESREKMALMGELLNELSHEIKNVNASVLGDQKGCLKDIDLLWSSLGMPATGEINLICRPKAQPNLQARLNQMSIPTSLIESKKALETLRIILASSALDQQQIDQVWAEILSSSQRQVVAIASMMNLTSSVLRMSDSARRTYEIIAIILRYGRDSKPNETCLLGEAIQDALQLLALKSRRAKVGIVVDIPEQTEVKISRIELGQIVLNLIHNAIDAYEESDQTKKQIQISCETSNDNYVHILCRNQAKPIDSEVKAKLFDRGFSTKGAAGSGLGLYISRRIALRVHGDLELRDNEVATCFDLKLEKAG
ncbi:MAG: ATP-binding protein [Oligoflexus sp.]